MAIVDRSGSMISCADEMRTALSTFFNDQSKEPGVCLVDYVQFDNQYDKVYEDVEVSKAGATLDPRGSTALLDAVGKGTIELGDKLRKKDESERPGNVIVVVVTDGHENASHEFSYTAVNTLVTEQQDRWNWKYIFLGANIDAEAVGARFGFKRGSTMTYDTANTRGSLAMASALVSQYRGGNDAATFSDEDRKKAVDKSK